MRRLSAAIDAYSERDGEQRFRRSLGWLLDGLFEDLLTRQQPGAE